MQWIKQDGDDIKYFLVTYTSREISLPLSFIYNFTKDGSWVFGVRFLCFIAYGGVTVGNKKKKGKKNAR
jgi:hypothetical protein